MKKKGGNNLITYFFTRDYNWFLINRLNLSLKESVISIEIFTEENYYIKVSNF